ncbi:uncharacterized protein K452DRAFT_24355 [Aplosporella prunicola CBS 121167]|uniref:Uncharacterized protein n=1 Tax=Aplosporella prunicola CBS 121167 TaxID=1176127 RepID=A0A6A6BFG6_9PEZI|nr:uncharacterized protein K452DRAFT_24355 [Aplosporella prunicola CBS 121167]KAF2141984.1 hypothetical protein K452DRAFT_24355 [Aplosporella prunicola CBS 121167]
MRQLRLLLPPVHPHLHPHPPPPPLMDIARADVAHNIITGMPRTGDEHRRRHCQLLSTVGGAPEASWSSALTGCHGAPVLPYILRTAYERSHLCISQHKRAELCVASSYAGNVDLVALLECRTALASVARQIRSWWGALVLQSIAAKVLARGQEGDGIARQGLEELEIGAWNLAAA